MTDYSAYIPAGELKLPDVPKNHHWEVQNIIQTIDNETEYIIKVALYVTEGENNTIVATVTEKWDLKKETFNDFAITTVGLARVALTAYQSFISIRWERDNDNLQKTLNYSADKAIETWTS